MMATLDLPWSDRKVAQLIENESETSAALNATYVTAEVDETGGVTLYLNGVEL
jgi:hypothetical protein